MTKLEPFDWWTGAQSQPARDVVEKLQMVAPLRATVRVSGPPGIDFDSFVYSLHALSGCRGRLVIVSQRASPAGLEALERHFALAEGGTLCLKDIETLSWPDQAHLLRKLKQGSGVFRVVAVSEADLSMAVKAKQFDESLYFRLNVIPLAIPSVHDTRKDVPDYIHRWMARLRERNDDRGPLMVSEAALDVLAAREWPRNHEEVREVATFLASLRVEIVTVWDLHRLGPGRPPSPPSSQGPPPAESAYGSNRAFSNTEADGRQKAG